jgi:very-short-patch-repair endonuclease
VDNYVSGVSTTQTSAMTAARKPRFDPSRPFTTAQAAAAGLGPRELRRNAYRRLFRGIYIDATQPLTPLVSATAALLTVPRGYASFASAARIHSVPIPAIPDEHVTVVNQKHRRNRPGIVCHYAPRGHVVKSGGIHVSDYAQTFCELATLVPLIDLVAAGDYLVSKGLISTAALIAFCAERRGAGSSLAREAVAYVRTNVDSPMESKLRMLLVLAGLPEPQINLSLRIDDGTLIRRYDLSWPDFKIAIEYDGRQHIERVENWESDLNRRDDGDDEGWRLITVTSKRLFVETERTLERIHRLARRRRVPGTPVHLSDAWRPHFPGRT